MADPQIAPRLWTLGRRGQLPKPSKGRGVFVSRKGHSYDKRTSSKRQLPHGLTSLTKPKGGKPAADTLVNRTIDSASPVGLALAAWRNEVIEDLGGQENVSVMQRTIIEMAARSKLILDSIDAWIAEQPTLINKQAKKVYEVVSQRQSIANGLVQHLTALGLPKRAKPVLDLSDYLKAKYSGKEEKESPKTAQPVVVEATVRRREPVISEEQAEARD